MAQPFKSTTCFSHLAGIPVVTYEVLYDGVKYRCDDLQLKRLYEGVDPVDLDLARIEEDDE